MSVACDRILSRLEEIGFEVRTGSFSPFDEELSLVTGVAWDRRTAQLAWVAETAEDVDEQLWTQLLFAGSGLRHHLAGDKSAAFGTPVILAVVDPDGERVMRRVVEELTRKYALFSRVDLNIVRKGDTADAVALDLALAPLLPTCRTMLGETVSKDDVRQFWDVLRQEVGHAAESLDGMLGEHRGAAASDIANLLIGNTADDPDLPTLAPLREIELVNFRSFEGASIEFAPVTIIQGANGTGKSSLLEAMELLWAGTSQRKPWDVEPNEYARHLPRDGTGNFEIKAEHEATEAVVEAPRAELARCVLTQELAAALVNRSPKERYAALLSTTGLEIPDLDLRTKNLLSDARRDADAALSDAGLPTLASSGADACSHLRKAVGASYATRLPSLDDVLAAERGLESAAQGAYRLREWPDQQPALDALLRLDAALAEFPRYADVEDVLVEAGALLRNLAAGRLEVARDMRLLLDAEAKARATEKASPPEPRKKMPVPATLAARWASHAKGVQEASRRFKSDAEELNDEDWRQRLHAYADALAVAGDSVPTAELEAFSRSPASPSAHTEPVADKRYLAAGLASPVKNFTSIRPHLEDLLGVLQRQAAELDEIASELERHPARKFPEYADRVLRAVARYEVARKLRRKGPVARASEKLVKELLHGKLFPVVRELVAAIARFEWYFKPLLIPDREQQVILGGLSTDHPELDARLLLNSAERTILGIGWFLALHLLQPEDRRQVLVLDDPTATFDPMNHAGFVATLRAFLRIARPQQVVVASHDDVVASLLSEDLAPVEQWPSAVRRLRCQRNEDGASVVITESYEDVSRDLLPEEEQLGLGGQAAVSA